jgi:Protease inhibitor Inh
MARLSSHHLVTILILTSGLAACEGSGRLGEFGSGIGRQATVPADPPPRQQTFTPAPMGRVSTSTLPPVTSQPLPPTAPSAPPASSGLPPAGSSVPIDPTPSRPAAPNPSLPNPATPNVAEPIVAPPVAPAPTQTASRPPEPTSAASAAPSRTSVTGNWTAKEAAGRSCKVTLSGTPTLDLYKASSAGCQSKELQRVNAWELRGDEVYLYEPGGGIAARLKKAGSNFEGSASKTGAPVTLSK